LDSTTQVITVLILLLAMVISVIVTQFILRRRNLVTLRTIPAYAELPLRVGEAIEANRPIHISLGSAGLGGGNTLLTLASAELFYQTAQRAAIGAVPPILTVSDPTAIPLGQDMLRRAYRARNLLERYPLGSVRWYPAGARSLAFAAALTATLADDRIANNVLVGNFGPELALVTDTAARRDQGVIAASDQLEGQAVAYAMSDQPLIGEEIFTAGAYLGDSATQTGSVVTMDILRLLLILAMLIPTAIAVGDAIFNGRFSAALSRLLGGG
jgi:hypothetical protein